MATFKAGGADWRVGLTLGTVGRLRTDAGFELGRAVEAGDVAAALFGDPERLGAILWVLVRDEAAGRGWSQDQFADALDGEALEAAATAVMEAVVDFFHRGRAAEIKKRLPGLMRDLNGKIGAVVAAQLDSTPSGSAGSSPGSSGATGPG